MKRLVLVLLLLVGANGYAQTPSGPDELTRARIANEAAQAAYYSQQSKKPGTDSMPAWLQTTLGGALAILGSIVTLTLTNRMTDNKTRRELAETYDRHEHQLRLATRELFEAFSRFTPTLPPFVEESLVYEHPKRPKRPSRSDRYYLKYDLVDSIYRLCAFLGWLELYRTDPAFMRGPSSSKQARIERLFEQVRRDLGAELVEERRHAGCETWRDGFILADDQRAIGETMLNADRSAVIGYAAFCERLFRDPERVDPTDWEKPGSQNWWVWNATRFVVELNPQSAPDPDGAERPTFAIKRVERLLAHLGDLYGVIR